MACREQKGRKSEIYFAQGIKAPRKLGDCEGRAGHRKGGLSVGEGGGLGRTRGAETSTGQDELRPKKGKIVKLEDGHRVNNPCTGGHCRGREGAEYGNLIVPIEALSEVS